MREKRASNRGFTILESVLAIFVVVVGIVGAHAIVASSVGVSQLTSSQLTAAYLAQEGIEIVRNIRDSNWVDGRLWNAGLHSRLEPRDYRADYRHTSMISFQNTPLRRHSSGLYRYDSFSAESSFLRKITLAMPEEDTLQVIVEVSWNERGKTHTVKTQENIYNWLP